MRQQDVFGYWTFLYLFFTFSGMENFRLFWSFVNCFVGSIFQFLALIALLKKILLRRGRIASPILPVCTSWYNFGHWWLSNLFQASYTTDTSSLMISWKTMSISASNLQVFARRLLNFKEKWVDYIVLWRESWIFNCLYRDFNIRVLSRLA